MQKNSKFGQFVFSVSFFPGRVLKRLLNIGSVFFQIFLTITLAEFSVLVPARLFARAFRLPTDSLFPHFSCK